jgi:hypothetical protein
LPHNFRGQEEIIMWISKRKYKEENKIYQDQIESLSKQNLELMALLPRSQVLGMMPYKHLVKLAERDYGIQPKNYDDKADLITVIMEVENQLKKMGATK